VPPLCNTPLLALHLQDMQHADDYSMGL
jgi:hypothetical protein